MCFKMKYTVKIEKKVCTFKSTYLKCVLLAFKILIKKYANAYKLWIYFFDFILNCLEFQFFDYLAIL